MGAADEVIPHVGIRSHAGVVRLGMTRDEVKPLLDRDRDIRVDFHGEPQVVVFVESPKHWGSFDGIDLLGAVRLLLHRRPPASPAVRRSYHPDRLTGSRSR